jgi:hypothetical protein
MKLFQRIILGSIIYSFCVSSVWGGWMSPLNIVSVEWGQNAGQVGLESEDMFDIFPKSIFVTSDQKIIIADIVNSRIIIFDSERNFQKSFSPIGISRMVTNLQWGILSGSRVLIKLGDKYQIYNYDGTLLNEFTGVATHIQNIVILQNDNIVVFKKDNSTYYQYSTGGELVKTSKERPLGLGIVTENKLSSGQYKVTVKFPDKTWEIIGAGACGRYIRDLSGNLYCVGDVGVIRYDQDGKEIAALMIPKKKIERTERDQGLEDNINVVEEYGPPVLAPNGDVYTWKRTPDRYYIIKWVWQ